MSDARDKRFRKARKALENLKEEFETGQYGPPSLFRAQRQLKEAVEAYRDD